MLEYRKQLRHTIAEYGWLKHVIPPCPPNEQRRCLDVGCGNWEPISLVIESLGYSYIGMDYDTLVKPPVRCDAHRLPFDDGTFDVILSFEAFEHLHSPWLAIREVGRVARENAIFIGSVPQLQPFHGDSYFNYTFMGIQRLLALGNFECDTITAGNSLAVAFLSIYLAVEPSRFLKGLVNVPLRAAMGLRRLAAKLHYKVFRGKLSEKTRQKILFSLEKEDVIFAGGLNFIAHKNSRGRKQW